MAFPLIGRSYLGMFFRDPLQHTTQPAVFDRGKNSMIVFLSQERLGRRQRAARLAAQIER
jgi:hypothetical protein